MSPYYNDACNVGLAPLQVLDTTRLVLSCIFLMHLHTNIVITRCKTYSMTSTNIAGRFQCSQDGIEYARNARSLRKNLQKTKKKLFFSPLNSCTDANFKVNSPKITSNILLVPTSFMDKTKCPHRLFLILQNFFKFFQEKFLKIQIILNCCHTYYLNSNNYSDVVLFLLGCHLRHLRMWLRLFVYPADETPVCRHGGCINLLVLALRKLVTKQTCLQTTLKPRTMS